MSLPRTVAEVLSEHVTLEVEGIDRMYLNVYQPRLQTERGVAAFFRFHRDETFASSALMDPISKSFIAAVDRFVLGEQIPLITFAKGQRKDDVAKEYHAQSDGNEGILFVGKAQEKTPVFRTEKRRNPDTGQTYPWIVRSTAMVNHYYFYGLDEDFGPFFPNLQPGDDVSGHDTFAFFVRARDGRYYDVAPKLMLQDGQSMSEAMVTRGISLADVDGDGRLDFALANQWQPSYFYHNECSKSGNFMGLHLLLPLEKGKATLVEPGIGHPVEEIPGRPAIGAAVAIRLPDGRKRVAQVDGGSGNAGKRAPDVHLGLDTIAEAPVEIRWRDPDGNPHEETFQLKAGWHTIRLGWPADITPAGK